MSDLIEPVAWRTPINPYGIPGFRYANTEQELIDDGHHDRQPLYAAAAVEDYNNALAEIERLKAALKPFTVLSPLIKDEVPDDTPVVNILGKDPLRAGHFRAALWAMKH